MNTTWRGIAYVAIHDAVAKARQDGLEGQAIIKAIDAAYPFGERAYFPYKAWLKERRIMLANLGLISLKVKPKPKDQAEGESGQLNLFE